MSTSASVALQTIRILNYIDNETLPATPAEDDSIAQALYSIHKLFPGCTVITCPAQHGSFFYVSDNCENIFGYSAEYMATHFRELASYLAQLHEADLSDFKECLFFLESFMKAQAPQDYHKMRMVLHYRFRHKDGQYQYLLDEKASFINSEGAVVHYCVIRSSPAETVFNGVKMEIFKQDGTLQKILEHKPSQAKKLTGRESELVTLIKQGLTTKEIAWQLSISHNTVRNIKSKLFEKFSVNNTVELLNMTA